MTRAQASLLKIDMPTVIHMDVSACNDNPLLRRPGATEVVQIGAAIRQQFEQLKIMSHEKLEELTQCLLSVVAYESNFEQFTEWLSLNMLRISEFVEMPHTSKEVLSKLQEIQVSIISINLAMVFAIVFKAIITETTVEPLYNRPVQLSIVVCYMQVLLT